MADSKKPAKTPDRKANRRGAARLAAVQALYQMDVAGTDIEAVIGEFVGVRFPAAADTESTDEGSSEGIAEGADATFFAEILRGVVRRQRDIDPAIDQSLAEGWRLVRIDSIVRASLRAGLFELIERPDVPARVVINEYIEVAHAFFDGDEPKVVNGVLDRLAKRLRPAEFEDRE